MGNVLDTQSGRDVHNDDITWLGTHYSAIFNDAYVSNVYKNLPKFAETDLEMISETRHSMNESLSKVHRLLEIYTGSSGLNATIDDFERLFRGQFSESTSFAATNKMRGRLLQRIHLAILREADFAQKFDKFENEQFLALSSEILTYEDANALLTATSVRMVLAFVTCLGPANPDLFRTMSVTLVDLLTHSSVLALSSVEQGSPQGETVHAIMKYAEDMAVNSVGDDRRHALGLMLAVAVTSGSVRDLLSVAKHLKLGIDRLPENSQIFINRLKSIKASLAFLFPTPSTIAGDFLLNISIDAPDKEPDAAPLSFCTDGVYLYCWDPKVCSLHKLGTGFHGTIAGNQYLVDKDIEGQVMKYLGDDVYKPRLCTAAAPSSSTMSASIPRRVRVLQATKIIDMEGHSLTNVFGPGSTADISDFTLDTADRGFEADILEELELVVDFVRPARRATFYRVSASRWLLPFTRAELSSAWEGVSTSDDEEENKSDGSDDDDDDAVLSFVCDDEDSSGDGGSDASDDPDEVASRGSDSTPRNRSRSRAIRTLSTVVNASTEVLEVRPATSIRESILDPSAHVQNQTSNHSKVASLACIVVQGKLYLRMLHLLGPHRIAVFSTSSLKLEDVLVVDIPIPELVKARRIWDQRDSNISLAPTDISEEIDEGEVEWQLGEEVNFAVSALGASVVGASSNFVSGDAAELGLLSIDEQAEMSVEAPQSENRFVFADTDSNQFIVVDLGQPRLADRIGAVFSTDPGDHPVQENFGIKVSLDGVEYSDWGVVNGVDLSGQSPCYPVRSDGSPLEVRYIRFEFGRSVENRSGSAVSKLLVHGKPKVKKVIATPFPLMTSDGRHLVFIHSATRPNSSGGPAEHFLQSFSVDPVSDFRTWTSTTYDIPLDESHLHQCSVICNSEKLILSHRKGFSKRSSRDKEAEMVFFRLDMETGKRLGFAEVSFPKITGFPVMICYDSRNNMVWSLDPMTLQVSRWRNQGLPPQFLPSRPVNDADMLLSTSPFHRIKALESIAIDDMNAEAEAALILSHLDRLAEPYSAPALPAAESRTKDEVEVTGGGYDDPAGCVCKFLIRGQHCGTSLRGFNLVVLNEEHAPHDSRNFDTHDSTSASDRMADFIEIVPEGSVVLVATLDEAVGKLTTRASAALSSLGAERIERLPYRGSFAMVGRKGASPGSVPQQMADKKKGPVTVRLRLPTPRVPLAVEATDLTISSLVMHIDSHFRSLCDYKATKFDKVMLISSLNLLSTNIFQLLRGSSISKAIEYISSVDRDIMMKIVTELISKPPADEGGDAIASCALHLFMTAIDVLYPSPAEKCGLLVRYLTEFVNDSLSTLEMSVLELLLRQMSDPAALIRLLHGRSADPAVTDPLSLVKSMLAIAKKETLVHLERIVTRAKKLDIGVDHRGHHVGVAAVQMLSTLCSMILSQTSQAVVLASVDSDGRLSDDSGKSNIRMLIDLMTASSEILNIASDLNKALCELKQLPAPEDGLGASLSRLDVEIDEALKDSPVGALLPTILNGMSLLTMSHSHKVIRYEVAQISDFLSEVLKAVQSLVKILPYEATHPPVVAEYGVTTSSSVFESEHPYPSNCDRLIDMSFKGAIKITIVFDERTKTENNYDYVRFYKDSNKVESWHPGTDKFTGRNGSENWPGFGGRAPLVIEGDTCWIEFHSDGSNEDWGWRLVATAEFKRQATMPQVHWLVELERQLVLCGSSVASALVVSVPWESPMEDRNAAWMEDSLFAAGLAGVIDGDASAEEAFLSDLADKQETLAVSNLINRMKTVVLEDQGRVTQINRAVYATCAALIKHNSIIYEAMSFANTADGKIPPKLISVWKAGQQLRQYFEGGQISSSNASGVYTIDVGLPSLRRGSSVMDSTHQAAEEIVKRAKFLLRLSSIPFQNISLEKAIKVVDSGARNDDQQTFVSPYGHVMSKGGGSPSALHVKEEDKLVELKNRQLKRQVSNRRRQAQRTAESAPAKVSISDKVLRFIQSNHNVDQLEKLEVKRNIRSAYRVQGYDLLNGLLSACDSAFSLNLLMTSYVSCIRSTRRSERLRARTHYMNAIEGCSRTNRDLVSTRFSAFLTTCVGKISLCYSQSQNISLSLEERNDWTEAVGSLLRACALDYDSGDHSMLEESGLLALLEQLIEANGNLDIGRTAWDLFEALLLRCVSGEGQRNMLVEAISPFSSKLISLLIKELNREATSLLKSHDSMQPLPSEIVEARSVVPGIVDIGRDTLGLCYPHVDLTLQHSFSLWLRRKPSDVEDILMSGKLTEGTRVSRGPDWSAADEDGGHGAVGTVSLVDGNCVTVTWDNKTKKVYKYGTVNNDEMIFEVSPIDENLGGHVYCKGLPLIANEEDAKIPWSSFGLELTPSAHLAVFIGRPENSTFRSVSSSKVTPQWTHVAVVQDRSKTKLYINGVLDSEKVLDTNLLRPGKADKSVVVVESPHPYRDNANDYTVVEVAGATSFSVTFDPQTKTEHNYDYIRFYRDESYSEIWGEDKYTGGSGLPTSNFPGVNGRPPLKIPSSRFIVHFKSDANNNDWGYKIICNADIPTDTVDLESKLWTLNLAPLYIGQAPSYASGERSAEVSLCGMQLFQRSLTPEELWSIAQHPPADSAEPVQEALCLNSLAITQKLCSSLVTYSGPGPLESSVFLGPSVLSPIMVMITRGTPLIQSAGLRLCSLLFPYISADYLNEMFMNTGVVSSGDFLYNILQDIGSELNYWLLYSNRVVSADAATPCCELGMGVLLEQLRLLQALAASELWADSFCTIMVGCIGNVRELLFNISNLPQDDMNQQIVLDELNKAACNLNAVFALLGFIGGHLDGLFVGSRANYMTGDEGNIPEACIVLGPTTPPPIASDDKDGLKLWRGANTFGDAFNVVLLSQPGEVVPVPRNKLHPTSQLALSPSMSAFLKEHLSLFVVLFTEVFSIDCADKRPVYIPKVKESDELQIFESSHPYLNSSDMYTVIKFPGAKKISIEFDSQSRTEPTCDFIRFYKDEGRSSFWGLDKYSGRDGDANWCADESRDNPISDDNTLSYPYSRPGTGGRAPLILPADSCVLHFHSDASNNDWGYKFTASAHCVVRTKPPVRPPLIHLCILSHLKLVGSKALLNLIEQNGIVVNALADILPPLVRLSMSSIPRILASGLSSKPLMLESGHPYDHSKDDYIPVRVKGSKKLVITFDEMTATENSCDYIRFYKDDQRVEYWGENQYTGGKDGGACNWPGTRGKPALVIPADHFVLYFHTDGSVNAWGWRLWVTGDLGSKEIDVLDPSVCAHRAQLHLQLLVEGPARQAAPDGLGEFEMVTGVQSLKGETLDCLGNLDHSVMEGNLRSQSAKKFEYKTLPRSFSVTSNLTVRESPDNLSKTVAVLHVGKLVRAVAESGDWLNVEFNVQKNDTSPTLVSGWTQRRLDDLIFLSPVYPSSSGRGKSNSNQFLVDLADDEENYSAENARPSKHPMFAVDDGKSNDSAVSMDFAASHPHQVLRGSENCLERSTVDMIDSALIGFAQECVSSIISKWPQYKKFEAGFLGKSTDLLNFIKALFVSEMSKLGSGFISSSPRLNTLKSKVLDIIRTDEDKRTDLCKLLIDFALKQMTESMRIETLLPPTRAVAEVIESKHPYDDNMDQSWFVTIPGAKWIKIVFDTNCSSEKDCDYCVIYKNSSKTDTWGPRYTGRANSADKTWAGVGGTPSCRVASDSCVIHFHSDGSNNDWGFKLTCYGVMEEPTDEQRDEREQLKASVTTGNTDLACWILEFLVKEENDHIVLSLYQPYNMRILRKYVEVMPDNKKSAVVNLITNILQVIPGIDVPSETQTEIALIKKTILYVCVAMYKRDISFSSSTSTAEVTQLLQAVVQAAVIADSTGVQSESSRPAVNLKSDLDLLRMNSVETKEEIVIHESKDQLSDDTCIESIVITTSGSPLRWSPDFLSSSIVLGGNDSIVLKSAGAAVAWSTAVCGTLGYHFGHRKVEIRLVAFLEAESSPIVGMTTKNGSGQSFLLDSQLGSSDVHRSFGWGGKMLYVSGCKPVPLSPSVSPGDIIGVDIDFTSSTVSLYRNKAFICVAIGPAGSGALIERDIGRGPFYPAASLLHPGDSVQLLDSTVTDSTADTGLQIWEAEGLTMPDWFAPIRESVLLLRSCAVREVPVSLLYSEFLPSCQEKMKVVIESAHPFNNAAIDERVSISGATSLTLYFHQSCRMDTDDLIRISGKDAAGQESQVLELRGLVGRTDTNTRVNSIAVGDKVVRGPSWDWGDQDGGAGNVGEVLQVRTWRGKADSGVVVKWKGNEFEGLYRWDFEGMRDLLIVGQWESSKKPITIHGDELRFEVIPKQVKGEMSSIPASASIPWTGAVAFNGNTSKIHIENRPEIELDADCTVELWIRLPAEKTTFPTIVYPLVSRQIEIDGKMSQYLLEVGRSRETPHLQLVLRMVNQSLQTALNLKGGSITTGIWHHVAATVQGKAASLYVNGLLVASGNVSGSRFSSLDAALTIGGTDRSFFKGNIFDFRIWNRYLTANQIADQKNDLEGFSTAGLVCRLMLNDAPPSTGLLQESSPGRSGCLVQSVDLSLDTAVEPIVVVSGVLHGFKCIIKPNYTLAAALTRNEFKLDLEYMRQLYTVGSLKHDLAIVRYVNHVSKSKNLSRDHILKCKWSEIAPTEDDLIRIPALKEILLMEPYSVQGQKPAADECVVEETKGGGDPQDQASVSPPAPSKALPRPVEARFSLLQIINQAISKTIAMVDLCMANRPWSIAALLCAYRGLILESTKMPFWEAAMQDTASPSGGQFELRLSRSRAAKHIRTGTPDHDARYMVFSQAFRQMHTMPPSALRRNEKLYNTVLMGERAQDAGGPYRESFAIYALELQSTALPLMIRTPNGRHSVGQNREKWLLNPGATSSTHMEMFAFLGKLMGIAIRTKEYLALNIPTIIWKLLVEETPVREDLEAVDLFCIQSLDSIRHIDLQGIDAEGFQSSFFETFTTMSTDDREVELRPGGSDVDVTFDTRLEFCDLVERYRLHEFDLQAAAVRRGLAAMVPARLLLLFTWDQLEMMVCGVPEVDIKLLQKVTEYSSCAASDEHVRYFWQALEDFDTEERSMFLRFTWGRSRLPLTADGFPQRFKLQSFSKTPPDNYFPVAHTCFFSLELPKYTSFDIMKDKLRYAIYNCQAIDGDDTNTGLQSASMDWEE